MMQIIFNIICTNQKMSSDWNINLDFVHCF